ncbi:MAG: MATE family efflux transporter [Butyrivibrio sp.]|nr:MATE family efflux transporter [Butyrivibrio sp.]
MNESKLDVLKKIHKLAIPGILSMILSTLFTIADEAIVGRIDVDGYTAVSISANIIYQVIGNLGAISVAFTILFAKSIGQKDKKASAQIFNTIISISILIGIVAEVLAILVGKGLIHAVYGVSDEILNEAYSYLVIAGLSIGINLVCFVMSGFFKNIMEPKIALIATSASLPVNFVLDYILVFGKFGLPKLRGSGAAIGTICGLLVEVIIYAVCFMKKSNFRYSFKINGDILKKTMGLFIPLLGQDFVENTIFVIVIGAIISRYNTVLYATYSVINALIITLTTIMYAYAGATMTLVGQAYSSDTERQLCIRYPKYSGMIAVLIYALILVITVIFPSQVCGIITDQFEILEKAIPVVVFALSVQLLNIPCQVYKYALQAIEQEKWVLIISVLMSALCCVIIFLNMFMFKLELTGVFLGFGIFYAALDAFFFIKYSHSLKKLVVTK